MAGGDGGDREGLWHGIPKWAALVGALALLIAALMGATSLGAFRWTPTPSEHAEQNRRTAGRIRGSAERACSNGLYRECIGIYEEAKRFDPAGDNAPEVQRNRAEAIAGIEAGTPPHPSWIDAGKQDAGND